MPRATMAKQLNIMKVDSTKKRPIMHIPQGGTRFTPGIIQTKACQGSYGRARQEVVSLRFGLEAASVGGLFQFKRRIRRASIPPLRRAGEAPKVDGSVGGVLRAMGFS